MALAVGIVLGSGPLKEPIDNTLSQQAEQLREQRNTLQDQLRQSGDRASYDDEVIAALAPSAADGSLDGRRVVVVTAPGADPQLAGRLEAQVTGAGGVVAGTVGVSDTFLDPANEQELDTVTTRLVLPGTTFPEGAEARERINTVLATALVTRGGAEPSEPSGGAEPASDPGAQALLTGLEDLGYLTVAGTPSRRAELALVVAAPAPEEVGDVTNAQAAALVDLAAAVDRAGRGTVVAGTQESAAEGALVRAVRQDGAVDGVVSTLDTADTAAGQLTAVLALAAEATGTTGSYGYGEQADSVLPPIPAAAAP